MMNMKGGNGVVYNYRLNIAKKGTVFAQSQEEAVNKLLKYYRTCHRGFDEESLIVYEGDVERATSGGEDMRYRQILPQLAHSK